VLHHDGTDAVGRFVVPLVGSKGVAEHTPLYLFCLELVDAVLARILVTNGGGDRLRSLGDVVVVGGVLVGHYRKAGGGTNAGRVDVFVSGLLCGHRDFYLFI
jgi:hypothetical protein